MTQDAPDTVARLYNREYDRRWAENGHDAGEAKIHALVSLIRHYSAEAWDEGYNSRWDNSVITRSLENPYRDEASESQETP